MTTRLLVGCKIEAEHIPVAEETTHWAERQQISPILFAMESGEEYELLLCIRPKQYHSMNSGEDRNQVPLFKIGRIYEASAGLTLVDQESETEISAQGWNHFRW